MNALLEKNRISEMKCGSNFAYILNENAIFLPTEYKVLQSQANSCFVKCMKMLYNGKIQFYYITEELKPLASMIPTLDADGFMKIISNLLADIIDVKHNGFLSCQNIDISFERIYVEPTTYKVQLVYLPISERMFADDATFENELRTGFVKLISGVSSLASPKTMQFTSDLSNGMLSLEDLHSKAQGSFQGGFQQGNAQQGGFQQGKAPQSGFQQGNVPQGGFQQGSAQQGGYQQGKAPQSGFQQSARGPQVRIVALNAPVRVELVVNKNKYIIGRSEATADGVVAFNKMIGRTHCRIDTTFSGVTITDLSSANGTFVNKVRVEPNQSVRLKNGDIIRLANSDFQVSIV